MQIRFKLEKDKTLIFQEGPCVLLEDTEGRGIWLPIFIAPLEFNSIVWVLNEFVPPRPITQDLLKTVIEKLDGTVEKVVVTKCENNIYFSELHLRKHDGRVVQVDSRSSDAISLALRVKCPILVEEEVIENMPEVSVTSTENGVEITYKDREKRGMPDLELLPTHDKEAMTKEFLRIDKPPDKGKLS